MFPRNQQQRQMASMQQQQQQQQQRQQLQDQQMQQFRLYEQQQQMAWAQQQQQQQQQQATVVAARSVEEQRLLQQQQQVAIKQQYTAMLEQSAGKPGVCYHCRVFFPALDKYVAGFCSNCSGIYQRAMPQVAHLHGLLLERDEAIAEQAAELKAAKELSARRDATIDRLRERLSSVNGRLLLYQLSEKGEAEPAGKAGSREAETKPRAADAHDRSLVSKAVRERLVFGSERVRRQAGRYNHALKTTGSWAATSTGDRRRKWAAPMGATSAAAAGGREPR